LGTPELESGDHKPKVTLCKVRKVRMGANLAGIVSYGKAECGAANTKARGGLMQG